MFKTCFASVLDSSNATLAALTALVIVVLALWHVDMALRRDARVGGALPTIGGKPLFVPTRAATLAVAVILFLFAALVLAIAGIVGVGLPHALLSWLGYALAIGLLGRAVGEFKYVGFFKRVRDSRFATLDTWFYSPLCLLLAIGVGLAAMGKSPQPCAARASVMYLWHATIAPPHRVPLRTPNAKPIHISITNASAYEET